MVLGAALDAGAPADAVRSALDSLGLPITLEIETVKRCGFAATKATVHAKDEENYRFLPDIEAILAKGALTDRQRGLALTIFRKLAEAEAAAHGMPLEKVHFHEVGALDSIADIVGAAVALDLLGAEKFTGSAVPTGSGTVKGAHGIMPVPAPGTAALLKGVPLAKSSVKGELTTPTGAAILVTLVTEFTDTPAMTIERIGTGAGTKDFIEQPNILRIFVGEARGRPSPSLESDSIWVLETNLDDCPPEVIGYAIDRLFAAGALDVYATPVQMKKNRPGVLLTVLADAADRDELEAILFRETATFGVRRYPAERSKLRREAVTVETPWGPVRAKRGWRADGFAVVTPEYDDCARVAKEHGVPLRDVYEAVRATASARAAPGA
jgi:uncharacterized protein (TIGR00299 family) protein